MWKRHLDHLLSHHQECNLAIANTPIFLMLEIGKNKVKEAVVPKPTVKPENQSSRKRFDCPKLQKQRVASKQEPVEKQQPPALRRSQ